MIVIVGGGISGLAAAYEIARRGIEFALLEASSRTGGLIRTERHGGFTIDAGADSMLATKPAARDFCADVGLAASLQTMIEPRTAFVLARNRLFALPSPSVLGLPLTVRGAMAFGLLPYHARVRLLLERFVAVRARGDESVASFFERRFGASTVELLAQPLLGGIHAGEVRQLSMRSLFPNLLEAEAEGGVLRGVKHRAAPAGGMFNSLPGGMDSLAAAASRSLPAGALRCGAEVHCVTRSNGGWRIEGTSGVPRIDRATAVIFATPMHVTSRLLQSIDAEAATLCAEIPHASTVSVALAWPRNAVGHPLLGSGFVVAHGENPSNSPVRLTACTWVSSKWDGRAPQGYVLLRAFMGGIRDPHAIDLPDDDVVAIAAHDVARVLGISGGPELTRVYRWRDASPQLTVGHDERVARIAAAVQRHPGLFVTGRGFRAVGIPDCISDARSVAGAAADYISQTKIRTPGAQE